MAEITAVGLDAVVDCRLIPDRVAQLREIMAQYDLAYSMHAPIAINLMDEAHADIMQCAALVSMDMAAEIGGKVVVLHPGRVPPKHWVDRRAAIYQFEQDQLGPVADRAAVLGVQIAYEDISPKVPNGAVSAKVGFWAREPRMICLGKRLLMHKMEACET